jgi:hypothetical protein
MSSRPSATSTALAIRSFASRPVGPLARADALPTGHAGPMFGPADRPTGSHVLSIRETVHMKRVAILVLILALPGWIAGAAANPWVYESGKSRHHSNDARHGGFELRSGRNVYRDRASIRRGHLPPHGKCQAWFLSRLPGC